jgi:hypothetical protein
VLWSNCLQTDASRGAAQRLSHRQASSEQGGFYPAATRRPHDPSIHDRTSDKLLLSRLRGPGRHLLVLVAPLRFDDSDEIACHTPHTSLPCQYPSPSRIPERSSSLSRISSYAALDMLSKSSARLPVAGSIPARFCHAAITASVIIPIVIAAGGLISYGFDALDQVRQATGYIDRILKGDKPAAISLETERAILIDIAQTYLRLAKEQEAQQEIIPPPVTGQHQPVAQQQEQIQPKDDDTKE